MLFDSFHPPNVVLLPVWQAEGLNLPEFVACAKESGMLLALWGSDKQQHRAAILGEADPEELHGDQRKCQERPLGVAVTPGKPSKRVVMGL